MKAIFDVVTKSRQAEGLKKENLRLLLGKDCVDRYEKKVERLREDLEGCRVIAESLDVEEGKMRCKTRLLQRSNEKLKTEWEGK